MTMTLSVIYAKSMAAMSNKRGIRVIASHTSLCISICFQTHTQVYIQISIFIPSLVSRNQASYKVSHSGSSSSSQEERVSDERDVVTVSIILFLLLQASANVRSSQSGGQC